MIMLISAPLASASRPIAEKTFSGIPSAPCLTTSSRGPLELARSSVGTTAEAPTVTRK